MLLPKALCAQQAGPQSLHLARDPDASSALTVWLASACYGSSDSCASNSSCLGHTKQGAPQRATQCCLACSAVQPLHVTDAHRPGLHDWTATQAKQQCAAHSGAPELVRPGRARLLHGELQERTVVPGALQLAAADLLPDVDLRLHGLAPLRAASARGQAGPRQRRPLWWGLAEVCTVTVVL